MIAPQQSLLDLPISFFEYDRQRDVFGNVPTHQTTLRRMVKTKYYRESIEAIRAEVDKAKQVELKKYLPAFTPVALLKHRKKDIAFADKVINQYPLLMGDVDLKENPDVDMAEVKRHIPRLPYVLLCAYSVRGGLWFIVRVPENQTPETLAAHFRYLQKLFSDRFGIKLDRSKGGNATDLRFVSYDPEPYINESPTVMTGTYTPPRPVVSEWKAKDPNDIHLLNRIISHVQKAGDGERHTSLLKASRVAGGYIGAGRLDEETAALALETVASDWPNFSKSQKTIRDGIRNGKIAPIYGSSNTYRFTKNLTFTNNDESIGYPAEWDLKPGQVPTCQLIPSPNRFYYAELTGIDPDLIQSLAPLSEIPTHN